MHTPSNSRLPGLPGFDPNSIQPWAKSVTVSMTIVALIFMGLRLVSRKTKRQELWWDDWMLLLALGWYLVIIALFFKMYALGMGLHADMLGAAHLVMMSKLLIVVEILYAWDLGLIKLSLLLMYYRIFRISSFKRMAWIVSVVVMAWVFCTTFLFAFNCVPIAKMWSPDTPGRCISRMDTWMANSAFTILTDLIILLMPLSQVWKLSMSKREKVGVSLAFGLGSFVVFASTYRTVVLLTYTVADPSYSLAPTVGWTAIEISAGIVSVCLPTLLPLCNAILSTLGFTFESRFTRRMWPGRNCYSRTESASTQRHNISAVPAIHSKTFYDASYRSPDATDHESAFPKLNAQQSTSREGLDTPPTSYRCSIRSSKRDELDMESSDEIPLYGMHVGKA